VIAYVDTSAAMKLLIEESERLAAPVGHAGCDPALARRIALCGRARSRPGPARDAVAELDLTAASRITAA